MADAVELEDYEREYWMVKRFDDGLSAAVTPLTFGRARIIRYQGYDIFDGW